MCAVLYLTLALLSNVFFATIGFVYVFLPVICNITFPIWFGLAGVYGAALGDLIYSSLFRGLGVVGIPCFLFELFPLIIYWLVAPLGYSELKERKHIIYLIFNAIWVEALIIAANLLYLVLLGFLPLTSLFPLFSIALIANIVWAVPLTISLFKKVTPILKNLGLYRGSYKERR
jgi:hypothetical protein